MKVKRDSRYAVLTGNAVAGLAVAVNDLLTEEAEALHRVAVPLAAGDGVFTEANHADFGAQGFGVLYRPAEVCSFECEHFVLRSVWACLIPFGMIGF